MVSDKRVLVTGGAGFIGSHLCERLACREIVTCLCVDNYFTGSKGQCLAHLMQDSPRFEVMRHDVDVSALCRDVDEIYNLACPASPVHYQHDPVQTTKTSVHGAINMLGLAKTSHEPGFFRPRRARCMAIPKVHPQVESYWGKGTNPIGTRGRAMTKGKRCAETLFFDYRRQHNLQIKVARIFNTYGPRMHPNDGRVVSNFIVQALRNDPVTIYGNGEQTRSFCYVDDLVEAFLRIMDTEDDFTGPVNIGNPNEFTIRELADAVIELTGSKSKIISKPLPTDDPVQRQPDITIARNTLGWEPKIQLKEGLQKTISYFDARLSDG